jgi:hypothetical protein
MNARRVRVGLLVLVGGAAGLWLTTSANGATGLNAAQPRIITGAGPGGGPDVRVFGTDGSLKSAFFAYEPAFHGGVRVATGHLNCDGTSMVVTAPGSGGGPNVKAFNADGSPYVGLKATAPTSFFAYDPGMSSGVTVAVGDLNGDGCDEIVTGTGLGGAPLVRVFNNDGSNATLDFNAYDPAFRGGVWVATGDVDGDGKDEIITGAGPGGGPHVRIFKYVNGAIAPAGGGFMAYDPGFSGGVRVGAAALHNTGNNSNPTVADRSADIITAPGSGGGPNVRAFLANGTLDSISFMAYDPAFAGGVFVGGDGNHTKSVNTGLNVATDVDGLPQFASGPGAGGGPHIQSYRGGSATPQADFFALDKKFLGGMAVAMGDFGPATTTTTTQAPRSTTTRAPTTSSSSTPTTVGSSTTTSAPATTTTTCAVTGAC